MPLFALLFGAGPVSAFTEVGSSHSNFVDRGNCTELDANRIQTIVTIEIASAPKSNGPIEGLSVLLSCNNPNGAIDINAWDPITSKRLQRRIASPQKVAANRVVALAIFQLYKASWLELMAMPASGSLGAPKKANNTAAEVIAKRAIRQKPHHRELSLAGGARLRSMGDPVAAAHTQLQFGRLLGARWGVLCGGGFDSGSREFAIGAIRFYGWEIGLGVFHRIPTHQIQIDLGLTVAAGYTLLRGISKRAGLIERQIGGLTGSAMVHASVGSSIQDLIVRLEIQSGYGIENPSGNMNGQPPFNVGGFYLGAVARLSFPI